VFKDGFFRIYKDSVSISGAKNTTTGKLKNIDDTITIGSTYKIPTDKIENYE
jgi:hypothetical protein